IFEPHYAEVMIHSTPPKPLHRKFKFNACIRKRKADGLLVVEHGECFTLGSLALVFVMINWSASNNRYHKLIRGVSFRNLLKRTELQVYIIDKFRISK
ncbi:MAG: hypothetical protein EXX96DRAFT_465525, partial [Benjaminiella poitrasii]